MPQTDADGNDLIFPVEKRYHNRFQRILETGCAQEDIILFPDVPQESIFIFAEVTPAQYYAIINSLMHGADILYPEKSDTLIWKIEESRHCMTSSLCAKILDCLQNDPDIRAFLEGSVGNGDPNNPIPDNTLSDPVYDGSGGGCDFDVVYGGCEALWDFIDQRNRDFLEIVDAATNSYDRASDVIEAVPIFGELPFDEILEIGADLGEYTLDSYLAAHTTTLRQQIICDLFCITKEDCVMDFKQLINYFGEFFDEPIEQLTTFQDFMIFLVSGTWASESIVYIFTYLQLYVIGAGSDFLGVDTITDYKLAFLAGDPDSDWSLFCECPDTFEHEFDFLVANGSWYNDDYGDGWFVGSGWQSETVVTPPRQEINYIRVDFPDTTITKITVEFAGNGNFQLGSGQQYLRAFKYLDTVQTEIYAQEIQGTPATQTVEVFDSVSGQLMDSIEIDANPIYAEKWHYTRVTIRGIGTDPFL